MAETNPVGLINIETSADTVCAQKMAITLAGRPFE